MKSDFELRIRQTDKTLMGNHEISDLLPKADSVKFHFGSCAGEGFSDKDYRLAKVNLTGSDPSYFLSTNGQYKSISALNASGLEELASEYQIVNRNKAMETVIEKEPELLENADAVQYLNDIIGDHRDNILYTLGVEFREGKMDENQSFKLAVLDVFPVDEETDKIYFAKFNDSQYVEVSTVEGESMLKIANPDRSLIQVGIKYFDPDDVNRGSIDNVKTPIGAP